MALYSAQCVIFPTSNLVADASTNTFSFDADDDAATEDIFDALVAFYNDIYGVYPGTVRQTANIIKIYALADPTPRAPVFEGTFNFATAPSGSPLPQEVAACISFQGSHVSGISQARRRGRVFIGPLSTALVGADGRMTGTAVVVLKGGASGLLEASDAAANWTWGVKSETGFALFTAIVDGWIDNAFDTQRRRGVQSTIRSPWDVLG